MHLSELLNGLRYEISGDDNIDIACLACDTSEVKKGCMFFCIEGGQVDGHKLYGKAVGDGAIALVVEHYVKSQVTQIKTEDTRKFMALVAKNYYHNAIDNMKLICVVGTNGKTSTTYLIDSIFTEAGYNTGLIGSNGVFICGERFANKLTTPDPIDLHGWFYRMYLAKVQVVIMEVSAHAIYLDKLEGVKADATVFTNCTQDHLDFFGTMEKYAETKASFFDKSHTKVAVVNADDELGRKLIAEQKVSTVSYGYDSPSDIFAIDFVGSPDGISYTMNLYDEVVKVNYSLCGKFNMYNTLAAATVSRIFGIKVATITQGITKVVKIDGRNETFIRKDGLRVVVDFAHTPDGIANILSYLKSVTKGRLIVVFGCGGNRDKLKRPLMGKVVANFADYVIVTNDNPRYEQPLSIVSDIEAGLTEVAYKVLLNRYEATSLALDIASSIDTVVILGKGAEKFQEVKGKKIPYSDTDTVLSLFSAYGVK